MYLLSAVRELKHGAQNINMHSATVLLKHLHVQVARFSGSKFRHTSATVICKAFCHPRRPPWPSIYMTLLLMFLVDVIFLKMFFSWVTWQSCFQPVSPSCLHSSWTIVFWFHSFFMKKKYFKERHGLATAHCHSTAQTLVWMMHTILLHSRRKAV